MNPASDYDRTFSARPQPLTLEQAARTTPPVQAVDTEAMIDIPRMRAYRRNRLRDQIRAQGLDALILLDPLSIRYATGVCNCAPFQMHIQAGYLFLPADGPVIYFDSGPGRETGNRIETIDEVRDALLPLSHMFAGHRQPEWARKWAAQMAEWFRVCAADEIDEEDLIRWDHEGRRFAVYRTEKGFFATDGLCTHEAAHLADGLVIGTLIECPLHQATFDIATGRALTAPAHGDLRTYPVKVEDGTVYVRI